MKLASPITLAAVLCLALLAPAQAAEDGQLASTTTEFIPYERLPLADVSPERNTRAAAHLLATTVLHVDRMVEVRPASRRLVRLFKRQLRGDEGARRTAAEATRRPRPAVARGYNPDPDQQQSAPRGDDTEALRPETVIGRDDRLFVEDTGAYPFRAVGTIGTDGIPFCTGTLIGPRHVLTAAHCVYDTSTDQWYWPLEFAPGHNGQLRPFGTVRAAQAIVPVGWSNDHLRTFDIALISLEEDVGEHVGWLGFAALEVQPRFRALINGYPGDKPEGTMWHSSCSLEIVRRMRLYYACDTFGGMSGSAVHDILQDDIVTYGVHAYGVDDTGLNGATRIHQVFFEMLLDLKRNY